MMSPLLVLAAGVGPELDEEEEEAADASNEVGSSSQASRLRRAVPPLPPLPLLPPPPLLPTLVLSKADESSWLSVVLRLWGRRTAAAAEDDEDEEDDLKDDEYEEPPPVVRGRSGAARLSRSRSSNIGLCAGWMRRRGGRDEFRE